VLDALGHHEHLAPAQGGLAISELDVKLSPKDVKDFVGLLVSVPDKVAL
jgi:hypothetical protein